MVTFRCNSGYRLFGSARRTCQENGKWSGTLTICDNGASHCPNPGVPINGRKSGRRYSYRNKVRFYCNYGYDLIGSAVRECLITGQWSGEPVTCTAPDDFDDLNEVVPLLAKQFDRLQMLSTSNSNKSNSVPQGGSRGRILSLSHAGGLDLYFIFDASASVGLNNFKKGIDFAKALVDKVGVSAKYAQGGTRIGALTYGSSSKINFHLDDDNLDTPDQVKDALDNIRYDDFDNRRGTATTDALRMVRTVMIPQTNANLHRPDAKKAVFLITDGRSNMGGNPTQEANALKDPEFDVAVHCVGVGNGVSKGQLKDIASTPTKEHLFLIDTYDRLQWLIDELTNTEIDYTPCGHAGDTGLNHRARIIGGNNAEEGAWPWQAALYRRRVGRHWEIMCGGSLIHPNWVLTAAHCIHNPDYYLDAEDIQVRLGITNRIKDGPEMRKVQVFTVERVIIPSDFDYDEVDDDFDNDIALLKLDHPAKLGPFVRTICLPDTTELEITEPLIESRRYGVVTGWGHSSPIPPTGQRRQIVFAETLQQVMLPVQSDDTCREDQGLAQIGINHFTLNMFCAGAGTVIEDEDEIRDSCKGDSGGPMARKIQVESEIDSRWVQIGIVSWAHGCAQEGHYGFYTHLPRMMSWIRQHID
ncbi:complement C2-like isoform X2 [Glandiceps talaboti]